jgi:hypothetical protein
VRVYMIPSSIQLLITPNTHEVGITTDPIAYCIFTEEVIELRISAGP